MYWIFRSQRVSTRWKNMHTFNHSTNSHLHAYGCIKLFLHSKYERQMMFSGSCAGFWSIAITSWLTAEPCLQLGGNLKPWLHCLDNITYVEWGRNVRFFLQAWFGQASKFHPIPHSNWIMLSPTHRTQRILQYYPDAKLWGLHGLQYFSLCHGWIWRIEALCHVPQAVAEQVRWCWWSDVIGVLVPWGCAWSVLFFDHFRFI